MINSKTFFLTALAASYGAVYRICLLANGTGTWCTSPLQSRFVKIADESFSAQTVHTGDTITVKGTLQSLVNRPLRAWLSLFSESTNAGNRWEFIARDPPGNIFDIPPQASIPYSITAKALEPGTYHVHTQLNIEHIGPGLG